MEGLGSLYVGYRGCVGICHSWSLRVTGRTYLCLTGSRLGNIGTSKRDYTGGT